MHRAWLCTMAAAVVMVAALGGGCEGVNIRPSLLGLLNAQAIEDQVKLIETLLGKLVNGSDCDDLKQPRGKDAGEEDSIDMEDGGAGTTMAPEKEEEEEEEEEEDDKMCDYEAIHADHTALLPPNDDCNVTTTGITDGEKDVILALHNELRAKVAEGNETRGEPGPQPPAANMHQLVWNEQLAEVAQAWASQCPTGHDKEPKRRVCSRKYRTGQNINYYFGVLDEGPRWQKAIGNWYSEVQDVDANIAAAFRPTGKKIGHYTQLIWGASKEIGCGIVYYMTERKGNSYTKSITHVCNYGPAGNVIGKPFYKHGPAASQCPGNASLEYPALCV